MNDFSMFVKEACLDGCEHDVFTHSVLCSWMGGLLSRASKAFIDSFTGCEGSQIPNCCLFQQGLQCCCAVVK